VVHERQQRLNARVEEDNGQPCLHQIVGIRVALYQKAILPTHRRKQEIVNQDSGEQEGHERKEDCAKEQLVNIVVPRIDAVAEHIVSLPYIQKY